MQHFTSRVLEEHVHNKRWRARDNTHIQNTKDAIARATAHTRERISGGEHRHQPISKIATKSATAHTATKSITTYPQKPHQSLILDPSPPPTRATDPNQSILCARGGLGVPGGSGGSLGGRQVVCVFCVCFAVAHFRCCCFTHHSCPICAHRTISVSLLLSRLLNNQLDDRMMRYLTSVLHLRACL